MDLMDALREHQDEIKDKKKMAYNPQIYCSWVRCVPSTKLADLAADQLAIHPSLISAIYVDLLALS